MYKALLLVVITAVTLFRCAPATVASLDRACQGGVGSKDKNHPRICIRTDGGVLSANPDTAYAFDRQERDGNPSEHPVLIQWVTQSGKGNLEIQFRDTGCVERDKVQCNGQGLCWALTVKRTDSAPKPCKYDVKLTDYPTLDPTVVIQPCCN